MIARILTPAEYQRMPWKNGHGTTHELAVFRGPQDAASGRFVWRLSIAEVSASAPFSSFPGCDRIILLLDGDGMVLDSGGDGCHELRRRFTPYAFKGEWQTDCRLLGGPCRDFNVMVDRERARAELAVVPLTTAPQELSCPGQAWALYTLYGSVTTTIEAPCSLYEVAAHHTLLLNAEPREPPSCRFHLRATVGEAAALLVSFTPAP